MSLKVQELAKKYWAIVNALLPKMLPQECWALLKGNPPDYRARLYFAGVVAGLFLLPFLLLFFPSFQSNKVFQSALAVFFLTFPLVTINWLIKNRDVSRQLEYSLQQQNETLFSNSLQLLFKENDNIANSIGLKELVKLKQERRIASDRIDLITSSGLQIEKASLENANLRRANLQGAYLQTAYLKGAFLVKANLQKIDLQKAFLKEANLQGADLLVAFLQEANLQGANLQGANLQGANLQGADLQGADLQGADLQGADLQSADIQGADLQEAKLQETNLKRSRYDEKTQFPDGFYLKQHEMILVYKYDV